MHCKLKYSSLLYLKKNNNSILYIKGPLGKNYLKVPINIDFRLDSRNKVIVFLFRKSKKKKKKIYPDFYLYF